MKREISLGGEGAIQFYLNREIGGGRINLELMKANKGGGGLFNLDREIRAGDIPFE